MHTHTHTAAAAGVSGMANLHVWSRPSQKTGRDQWIIRNVGLCRNDRAWHRLTKKPSSVGRSSTGGPYHPTRRQKQTVSTAMIDTKGRAPTPAPKWISHDAQKTPLSLWALILCVDFTTDLTNRIRIKALNVFLALETWILAQIPTKQRRYLLEFPFGTTKHVQDEKHQNNDFYLAFFSIN